MVARIVRTKPVGMKMHVCTLCTFQKRRKKEQLVIMPKHRPNPELIKRLEAAGVIAAETAVGRAPGILIEQDLELFANTLSETETGSCRLIIDCSFTSTLSNSFMV